jgi:MSHA pilin protein MshC
MKTMKSHKGFTLIEIISVLILIGIISVVVIARMSDTRDYDLATGVEVIKSHLRYAQSRAMISSSRWGINFTSGTTYYLFNNDDPGTPVRMLGEDNETVNLVAKQSELTITSSPQTVIFDAYGSPGETTITVTTNGENIIVTKNTGFIP